MPIVSPELDDLSFEQVVTALRQRIPVHAPEWTDHNDADPGIALIQLFGYLTEQIGYRLNRVPDKNFVEFLKLIGIRLRPAEVARATMAFVLTRPEQVTAFALPAFARIKAGGDGAPTFETDVQLDVVPAQLAALVTTSSDDLRDIRLPDSEVIPADATAEDYLPERFSLVWNGVQPELADMPTQPLGLFARPSEADHRHLWIGLAFNPSRTAGFLGQRVTLTAQLDDDEQPDARAQVTCEPGQEVGELTAVSDMLAGTADAPVSYAFYQPARPGQERGTWRELIPIADTTDAWTRSGQIRFDVPMNLGPIPDGEWVAPRVPEPKTLAEICAEAEGPQGDTTLPTPLDHPLVGALEQPVAGAPENVPISGWLRVSFATRAATFSLRLLSFNVAPARGAQVVTNEVVGRGNGRPDQTFQLAFGNILADTLDLAVVDAGDGLFHGWREVADFDAAGPSERVYFLDREAGTIVFGDGLRGRPPERDMRILARSYRHGGGMGGELAVGRIDQPESLPAPITAAFNITAARGGRDAETLEQAKRRAPRELAVRGRAVTAGDFEFLALQTPGVRIARAIVVPLRMPYPAASSFAPGLDLATRAAGVVSVVAVPDAPGPFPTPTRSMLRAVCRHLDEFRLLTTEVYVAAPQYVRLFNLTVELRARPGYGRTQLREDIGAHLARYFHPLRGGPEHTGFGFGATVHHADIMAQIFQVPGVDRVEALEVWYDGHAPAPIGDPPPMSWRPERGIARRLTNCRVTESDDEQIVLAPDETVFVDATTLNVIARTDG